MNTEIDHNVNIGTMIKELRTTHKMTLKQLSESTGLSTGFLSQLERGMSTIAIDSLAKIAEVFNTDLQTFFKVSSKTAKNNVMRSFEQDLLVINQHMLQYTLTENLTEFNFLPRIFELLPSAYITDEDMEMYNHSGEEFMYVLEGILTVTVGSEEYNLYPGDSIQLKSDVDHNWTNNTNKKTKFLTINVPNPFIKNVDGDQIDINVF